MSKVGVLLSGGMDSYALTYLKRPDIAVTIDYGQRPALAEFRASEILANRLGIEHLKIRVNLRSLGSGDLAGTAALEAAPASDWWPFRNQVLLTLAAMRLISEGVIRLLIASVKSDSNHQDGTKVFVDRISNLISGQEGGMLVEAPAIELSTAQLVRKSEIPYSLLAWSHSCHTSNIACGRCRGCIKHREVVYELGFAEA